MGLSVWYSYGSFVGLPIWASPYTSDTGPTWAWYLGPTWVLYRLALMSKPVYIPHCAHMGLLSGYIMGVPICVWPYWTHMGPIWACPYWQARIHRTQATYGLAVLSPHGFFMSLPLCACYLGPTWVLYGVDHMGKPYTSHTGLIWACYLGPTWVFYGKSGIHPTLGPYGIAIWAPHSKPVYITYGSYMGVPIWTYPYTPHTRSICACYLGPTWVLYGCAHIGLTVWDPYESYMGVHIWASPYISHTGPIKACYLDACLHCLKVATHLILNNNCIQTTFVQPCHGL